MSATITLTWKMVALFAFALLAAGGLLGTLAVGLGRAADHHPPASPEVRVFAEPQADGRIAVGVQQRGLDGEWARVYQPTRRFVPADADAGRRLYSSPVTLSIDDGREAAKLRFAAMIYTRGQSAAAYLNQFTEETVLCINLDLRDEGRERFCDGLEDAYPGTVNRLNWDDAETLAAEIHARIEAGDAPGGMAATSYPAVVIAGQVQLELRRAHPLTYYGQLIEPIPPAYGRSTYCLIRHGGGDFWDLADEAAGRAGLHAGIEIQLYRIFNPESHSDAIRDCVAGGATALTTTLGDPEGVRDALAEATAAGVRVVSFNSGANAAADLGSAVHIAVDEQAIGEKAGEAFNRHEVSGDILCVIHESGNIGLSERCEGLEAAYQGGSVEVFPIYDAEDWEGAIQLLARRLSEGGVGAVFTLSSNTAFAAGDAIGRAQSDARLATVGFDGGVYEQALRGQILFAVWDQPILQAYLSVASMLLADQLQIRPAEWFGSPRLLIEPRLYERADIIQLLGQLIDTSR